MPGSGTKLRNRNTISAPTVNQMRFFSSVALEKFAKLSELAMLSAREAIGSNGPYPGLPVRPYRE